MEQRVSLVTLGVEDLERARRFYEALGWGPTGNNPGVVFFQAGGMVLALWSRAELAQDAGMSAEGSGFRGSALAYNARSRDEVNAVLAEAEAARGRVLKPGTETAWGGYAGYFADPDEHLWEVAHNPFWTVEADGSVRIG